MTKCFRSLSFLFFALYYVSLVSCSTTEKSFKAQTNTLEKTINEIKSCIVQIKAQAYNIRHPYGSTPDFKEWIVGTGFLVNEEGYIITNAHVILDAQNILREIDAERREISVGLAFDYSDPIVKFRGSFILTPFKIIEIDEINDIAILKTNSNPFKGEIRSGIVIKEKELPIEVSVCKLALIQPTVGTNIAISGYPLSKPTLITSSGIVSSNIYPFEYKNVLIKEYRFLVPQPIESFMVDAIINPGNSGGPVYFTDSGKVIGIASAQWLSPIVKKNKNMLTIDWQYLENSGLTKVIPINKVIELLKKHNIALDLEVE